MRAIFHRSSTLKKAKDAKKILDSVLEATEKALSSIPIPGARAAIGKLLAIMPALEKTTENTEAIQELAGQLERFTDAILRPLEGHAESDIPRELIQRIDRLTLEWNALSTECEAMVGKKGSQRLFSRTEHSLSVAAISGRIKESLDRFGLTGDLVRELMARETHEVLKETQNILRSTAVDVTDGLAQVQDVNGRVETIAAVTQNIEKIVIGDRLTARLDKLPNDRGAYNLIDSGSPPSRCFQGTREKLISDIMTWFRNDDAICPQLFFLNGIAGIGKSTVASTVASMVDETGELGASHFFSRAKGRTSPTTVFTSFAYQLSRHDRWMKKEIAQALEDDPDAGFQVIKDQFRKLIVEPLARLPHPRHRVLLVIDALDECQEAGAVELLAHLLSQLQNIPFVKVLITGRPEHHITSTLNQRAAHQAVVMHDIEQHIVEKDIELFYRVRFEELQERYRDMGILWKWTEGQLRELIRRAGKLFIYAVTVYNYLGDSAVSDPAEQMNAILDASAVPGSSSPYAELDGLYLQLLQFCIPQGRQDPRLVNRFRQVVGSIVTLVEPLSVSSLALLLDISEDQVRASLVKLPSVISVPALPGIPLEIYHPSFPDFLHDSARCVDERFLVQPAESHSFLAIRCLSCLVSNLKRDICDIGRPLKLNADVQDLDDRVKVAISPWLRYACIHWGEHVAKASVDDQEIKQHLEDFCKYSLLHWLEALSLLGCLEKAAPFLRGVQVWAESSGSSDTVLSLLHDVSRTIPAFFEVISSGALHIYYSVIPFLPLNSEIRKTYKNAGRQSVRVVMGGDKMWNPCIRELRGPEVQLFDARFSPDGRRCVTASEDKTARVWDAATGQDLFTLEGHTDQVHSAQYSLSGHHIITSSSDHTARVWNALTGQHLFTLAGHIGSILSTQLFPNGKQIVTASDDGTARVWDSSTGAHLLTLEGHTSKVYSTHISPNAKKAVTASEDTTARVWNLATGRCVLVLEGHSDSVVAAQFSPDGRHIVTASDDNTARIWDSANGEELFVLDGHGNGIVTAQFFPDGKRVISASLDTTARIWDFSTGQHLFTFEGHTDTIRSVQFSPNNTQILTASDDTTAQLWDSETGRHIFTFEGHTDSLMTAQFSPHGKQIVTSSYDGAARVWDVKSAENSPLPDQEALPTQFLYSPLLSPDGKYLITHSSDMTAQLWNPMTGQQTFTLEGHTHWVRLAQFSPNSMQVVTTSADCTARVWNPTNGDHLFTLEGHTSDINYAQFSPDGNQILTTSDDGTGRLWDATTGEHLFTLKGHTHWIRLALFSPRGDQVVTASADHTARVWSPATGDLLFTLEGHSEGIDTIEFSLDGKKIVTSSQGDMTARIWKSTNGQHLFTLEGHTSWVRSAQFSPSGQQVVTASDDTTARIWDTTTGQLLDIFNGSSPFAIAQYIGEHLIILLDHDYTSTFWALDPSARLYEPEPLISSPAISRHYTVSNAHQLSEVYRTISNGNRGNSQTLLVCMIPQRLGIGFESICHENTVVLYNHSSSDASSFLILDFSPLIP